MKKRAFTALAFGIFTSLLFFGVRGGEAVTQVTAQEAYDMLLNGGVTLIDVRTLEECVFVGSPALEAEGDPIAYLIPWKLFDGIDATGKKKLKDNPDFDGLIEQTFGQDKDQVLIVMCGVGIRSTQAANRLQQQLGFSHVYEIDNELSELSDVTNHLGGYGGFEGPGYNGAFNGFNGYPGRLSVVMETGGLVDIYESVSWMDTGLPITHKTDPVKIPKLKETSDQENRKSTSSGYVNPFSYGGFQTPSFYWQPSFPSFNYQPFLGSGYQAGNYFSFSFSMPNYLNQPLTYYSSFLNPFYQLYPNSDSVTKSSSYQTKDPGCG